MFCFSALTVKNLAPAMPEITSLGDLSGPGRTWSDLRKNRSG